MTTAAPEQAPRATDWDAYYAKPFAATRVTRRFTERALIALLQRYAPGTSPQLVELGGANSCFFNQIQAQVRPSAYHVIDFNRFGLDRMRERLGPREDVHYYQQNVLDLDVSLSADAVFSIGLIEHFSPQDTARAVAAHAQLVRPGGAIIISFPTPTRLYRATRRTAEIAGRWAFHDERPLLLPEVSSALEPYADILEHRIVWPIMLTQMFIAARRRSTP